MRRVAVAAFAIACAALPLRSTAAQTPVSIPVYGLPGAFAAVDASGTATIDDAAAGRLRFVPVANFTLPASAAYLRQAIVWVRIPNDGLRFDRTFAVETSFDVNAATLYAAKAGGGWTATDFGMSVPYAQRPIQRLVPTARVPEAAPGPLFLRLAYERSSPRLLLVNDAAIAAEEVEERAQEPAQEFFLGVFVTLALTNLALFTFARSYLYVLYSFAMMLAAANTGTVGYPLAWKWFWPALAPPHFLTYQLLGGLAVTAIVFLTSELLSVRDFWPRVDRFVRAFAAVAFLNGVASALWYASLRAGPATFDELIRLAQFVPFVALIACGIQAWRLRNPNAPFVVIGYACQTIGIGLYISNIWVVGGETHAAIFVALGLSTDGLLLFGALAARLQQTQREAVVHARLAAEQRLLASTDGLTGVANRRAYDEALAREWERAARDGSEISLIIFDVDFFKRYNDTYGHVAGDLCLQHVAKAAQSCLRRPGDLFARYGGEEFVALLPQTSAAAAFEIAEAMCAAVKRLHIEHSASSLGIVSISAGVAAATARPFAEMTLARAADAALYRAKESGRNRAASLQRLGSDQPIEPALH